MARQVSPAGTTRQAESRVRLAALLIFLSRWLSCRPACSRLTAPCRSAARRRGRTAAESRTLRGS